MPSRFDSLFVPSEATVADQLQRTADSMRDATIEFVGKKASVEIECMCVCTLILCVCIHVEGKVNRGNFGHGVFPVT